MFLLSNRGAVAVDFWPFGLLGRIALGAVILIALAAGLFVGLMLHWPQRLRARRRARLAERRAEALQARLDALTPAPALADPPPMTILPPERVS
jgi:hypothetical protein